MSERPADLGSEVRRIVAEELAVGGGHPPPEELIAYHRRSLPEPRAEALRDHLAVCAECTRLLLEFDEHWATGVEAESEPAYEPWHRRPGSLRALAATLAAVALGLAAWIATHGPAVRSGYLTENLKPVTSATRGIGGSNIEVPEKTVNVVLILNAREIQDPAGDAVYTATLRSGGAVIDRTEGLLDEEGQFTLIVPSRKLLPGDYEIVLRGPGVEATELEYRFPVVRPGARR